MHGQNHIKCNGNNLETKHFKFLGSYSVLNNLQCKEGEGHAMIWLEGTERGWRYSFTLSSTSALDGGG